jgi:ABC-2 type transport system permease protein
MNPYLNDLLRIMRGRAAITSLIIIILFSLLVGYATAFHFVASRTNLANTFYMVTNYYSNSTEVHYITRAFNRYGQPLKEAIVLYELKETATLNPIVETFNTTTNLGGFANMTFTKIPPEDIIDYTTVTLLLENSHGRILEMYSSFTSNQNQLAYGMQVVMNPRRPIHAMVHIVYLGPPSDYGEKVGLYIAGNSGLLAQSLAFSYNYTFITELSNFTVENIPIYVNANNSANFYIGLYNSSGDAVSLVSSPLSFIPPQKSVLTTFYSFAYILMPGFIPLLAVSAGCFYFGRERVEGVLESILVRPVSRSDVITSRFVASVLLLSIASAIGLVVIDLLVGSFTGLYISGFSFLYAYWSILVMSAGFLGITYLLSCWLLSSGPLIGISIAVYVLLSLLWPLLSLAIQSAIGLHIGGKTFIQFFVTMLYLSPSGYISLGGILQTGNSPILGSLKHLSTYGLTGTAFLIGGLAWSVLLFLISLIRFSRYD